MPDDIDTASALYGWSLGVHGPGDRRSKKEGREKKEGTNRIDTYSMP